MILDSLYCGWLPILASMVLVSASPSHVLATDVLYNMKIED
jgi:hypothetical protein